MQNKAGGAHDEGRQFLFKMAAVIGIRGMKWGNDFQLSTNQEGSGNFDDLVYTTNTRRYFLHLKNIDNPDTTYLQSQDMAELLHKCIIQDPTFKDIPIERSEFIIYTNQHLGPKCLKPSRHLREIDVIFKTCDTGQIFNFTPGENKEIDVNKLEEDLVKKSTEFGDLSPTEREVKLKMISEFLKKLIMVTGQKGQRELDDVITEEIRQHDAVQVGPEMYKKESLYFKMLLETCLKNKKEKVTVETTRNCLQDAKTRKCASDVRNSFDSSREKHYGTEIGIDFSDSEIARLQVELSNRHAVHLKSDALTLCSTLLLDSLPQSKRIFVKFECLKTHTDELLHAWLGGIWEWLIVFCDSKYQPNDISDTCLGIIRRIESVPLNKCLIILTSRSVTLVTDFVPIEPHEINFEQLSKKSQALLLDKKIDFQGCEVTMRDVLQRHGNVEHVLGPELVKDLITERNAVNIGGKLQVNEGYYTPITLERKIYLKLNVLGNSDSYPDIFAVSGMEKKDVFENVHSYEIVGKFCLEKDSKSGNWIESFNKFKPSRFIILKSEDLRLCFSKLCKMRSGKTLHWLKRQNGCLLWRESRGSVDSLIDFVDSERTRGDKRIITEFMMRGSCEVKLESISNLSERTVLVVAESDMRKNTTTQVAWHTKLADPTSWVVLINWNDHTEKLQEINSATFNFNSLVDFLCSVAFSISKYTDINRILLKQALQYSGNVTVFMDWFDELNPTHADKASAFLPKLMETKVKRVWVTSRPAQRKWLEEELCATAFTLS